MGAKEKAVLILSFIDLSIDDYIDKLPTIEKKMFSEVQIAIKNLDLDSAGNIKRTTANLAQIGIIRSKIQRILQGKQYKTLVKDFSNDLIKVRALANDYFSELGIKITNDAFSNDMLKQSIVETRVSLGIASTRTKNPAFTQRVVNRAMDIVSDSVKSGIGFGALNEELRDFIVQDANGVGALKRFSQQVATDAINQYHGSYQMLLADKNDLTWFRYIGSLIRDSRAWCVQMVAKEFAHRSELPLLPKDIFPQDLVPLNSKTGLPAGMIAGTDGDNLVMRRGGWNCRHEFFAVIEESVPQELLDEFSDE